MTNWIDIVAGRSAARGPCVLVTLAEAESATPREAGPRIVVLDDAGYGAIGGGNLKHKAIEIARGYRRCEARRARR